ncbi:MAG TPA: hypothetical protein VG604_04895 [Candidatus Saccharimonadales bacterium]|nr:hypothetical protein [Candidatus Saccharimonadales bacterium]
MPEATTTIGGVEIPHRLGEFNVGQGLRFLSTVGLNVVFPGALGEFIRSQPTETREYMVGLFQAEQDLPPTDISPLNVVFMGLMMMRDQHKLDVVSVEALDFPLKFTDNERLRSGDELHSKLRGAIRFNAYSYFQIADRASRREWQRDPKRDRPMWAGFIDAYLIGSKQAELSKRKSEPQPAKGGEDA